MAKTHVRCRKCNARRVLAKHPDLYQRLPVCRSCGTKHRGYLVVKVYKQISCYCIGYHFPHRYLSPQCIERTIADNCGLDWNQFKGGKNPINGVLKGN